MQALCWRANPQHYQQLWITESVFPTLPAPLFAGLSSAVGSIAQLSHTDKRKFPCFSKGLTLWVAIAYIHRARTFMLTPRAAT